MALSSTFRSAIGVAGFVFAAGFGIGSDRTTPANAIVYLDLDHRTYFAPPCVNGSMNFMPGTARDAYAQKFSPDPACRDSGAFLSEDRSLSGQFLETLGLLTPKPSRWNPDGSWRW